MRAFVVRPFGKQQGVDFDKVHAELIKPALEATKIDGDTTLEIVEQGDIREDMFRLLVSADLVVADISIHNANVFYELGIRHAVLDRHTLLISSGVEAHVFDLKPDRYLAYNKDQPKDSLSALTNAIIATINSEHGDSPVFRLLPNLRPQDRAQLLPVPADFRDDVDRAKRDKSAGDLRLYATEVTGQTWEAEGLRLIGRSQIDVKAWRGACDTFERLRSLRPKDPEIYERLGTIYQRLGDLVRSDQAIQRQLELDLEDGYRRAEAYALMARNEKDRWQQDFANAAATERQAAALSSPHLQSSIDLYADGFSQSLNHFYSGLNALALLKVLTELAREKTEIWQGMYDDNDQATAALAQRTRQMSDFAVTVKQSLAAAEKRLSRTEQFAETDEKIWTAISEADLTFLTMDRAERITNAYRVALKDGQSFHHDAARRQIEIYQLLGLFPNRVEASLKAIEGTPRVDNQQKPPRVLLFTGHMVDAPDRKTPRFPRTAPTEAKAKAMIQQAVTAEKALAAGGAIGISGGACGGDILFHEICQDMNIATRLFLALPQDKFQQKSVQHGGPDWVERYRNLCERTSPVILADSEELPSWLRGKAQYTIWDRSNLWMLSHALAMVQGQGARLTLISLWDGQGGDGPGGTADMVRRAVDAGAKHIALDAKELLAAR